MSFQYSTMLAKYINMTGIMNPTSFNTSSVIDNGCIKVVITIEDYSEWKYYPETKKHCDIRDWCEEQFGDNWIYNYNEYYFKYEHDATLFALKWGK